MTPAAGLPHPLVGHSLARPEHTALCTGLDAAARRFSYRQLAVHSAQVAAWLKSQGVGPGDRVALLGPHTLDYLLAVHSIGWLGAVAVPLPPPDGCTPEALGARLGRSGARWCVILEGTPQAHEAVCCQALDAPPLQWRERPVGDAGLTACAPSPWLMAAPQLLLETSGTSGQPTQVLITTQQLLMQSLGSATRLGHATYDIWLDVLPLHHVGGLMIAFRALIMGATVCLPGGFDALQMAHLLHQGPVTLTSMVPTMLRRLLPHLSALPIGPKLRAVLLGGAPTPQELLDAAEAAGVPVAITWGMTEAASSVCVRWPRGGGGPENAHGASNAGPPLPFVSVWADDAQVLHVAGPTVMGPGALCTSDRGQLLSDGTVHILGRADRVIISGGENIAPEEVEAVLLGHAEVLDAAVVGVADPEWGERPVAHLVARGAPVADRNLVAFCRARLASFQIPARFVWHAHLPRDAMGKLQRTALSDAVAEDGS